MLSKLRLFLWILVGLAGIGAIVLAIRSENEQKAAGPEMTVQSIGGPFTLTGSDSKPFSSQELSARPYVIFFGFTHCPDVCPTTLARLVKLRRGLDQGEKPFEILFVTVDPDRDGPAEVGAYSKLFDSPVIGLTGSAAAIDKVKRQFGVYSEKVGTGSDYTVNHTATIFLMDGSGRFVSTISPEENDDVAREKIERLTKA